MEADNGSTGCRQCKSWEWMLQKRLKRKEEQSDGKSGWDNGKKKCIRSFSFVEGFWKACQGEWKNFSSCLLLFLSVFLFFFFFDSFFILYSDVYCEFIVEKRRRSESINSRGSLDMLCLWLLYLLWVGRSAKLRVTSYTLPSSHLPFSSVDLLYT